MNSSNRSDGTDSKLSNEIFFDFFSINVPEELKRAYTLKLSDMKDLLALREVNQECRRLVNVFHNFQNFDTLYNHFKLVPDTRYILSVDKLTVADVRLGNQLVIQAIALFQEQSVPSPLSPNDNSQRNPEILLRRAMCRYGSYHAMQCIQAFSKCPGRKSLNSDMNPLIEDYKKRTVELLGNISETNFGANDNRNKCENDLNYVISVFQAKVDAFVYALTETYMKSPEDWYHRKDHFKILMERHLTQIEEKYAMSLSSPYLYEAFDAKGYIGLNAPNAADAWYLREELFAEHTKREQLIDEIILPTSQLSLK